MIRPGNGISNEAGTYFVDELKMVMKTAVGCVIVGSNYGVFSYEPGTRFRWRYLGKTALNKLSTVRLAQGRKITLQCHS